MTEETGTNQVETSTAPKQEQVETQVQEQTTEKALTQDDINKIVAERVARERAKFEKKYSNVDVNLYNELVEQEEQRKQQELEKRGEYERLLKEQAEKFNSKIHSYESELHSIKIDGTLMNEATNAKAINPQQVVALLKGNLKLNEAGGVDVVDAEGKVRYDDNGKPIQVSTLMNEFLSANPHFQQAGAHGSGTQGAVGKQQNVDLTLEQLDMKNPAHRQKYREMMKAKGVRV